MEKIPYPTPKGRHGISKEKEKKREHPR